MKDPAGPEPVYNRRYVSGDPFDDDLLDELEQRATQRDKAAQPAVEENPFVVAASERHPLSDGEDTQSTDPGLSSPALSAVSAPAMSDDEVNLIRQQHRRRLKSVEQLVQIFLKAGKTLRLYSGEHRNFDRFTENFIDKLEAQFEDEDFITFEITPKSIVWEGNVVFTNVEQRANLAYKLYADGVRLLQFRKGVTRGELSDFIALISNEAYKKSDEASSDLSVLFWEADFKFIELSVAETFVDELGEDGQFEHMEQDVASFLADFGLDVGGEMLPQPESDYSSPALLGGLSKAMGIALPGQGEAGGSGRIGDKGGGGGFGGAGGGWLSPEEMNLPELPREVIDERAMEAIYHELHGIEQAYASFEEVGAVIAEVVLHEKDAAELERFIHNLDNALNPLLSSAALVPLNAILRRLALLVRLEPAESSRAKLITELLFTLGKQDRLALLAEALNNDWSDDWKGELFTFVSLQHPENVEEILLFLKDVGRLPARRVMVDAILLLCEMDPEVFLPFLRRGNWHLAADAVYALGKIGDPTALDQVIGAFARPEHQVRQEVLVALRPYQSPRISSLMINALQDEHEEVRLSALRYLAVYGVRDSIKVIQEVMQSKAFRKRSFKERRGWYMALGGIGRRGVVPGLIEEADALRERDKATEVLKLTLLGIRATRTPESKRYLEDFLHRSKGQVLQLARQVLE